MADKHRKDAEDDNPMPADAFRAWRKRLGLKQKDAADLLGLKKRMIQYYETGSRSGKDVTIPKSIRLACYALDTGVTDYDGKSVLSTMRPAHAHSLWASPMVVHAENDKENKDINSMAPNIAMPSEPTQKAPKAD